jgi:glycosidase
MKSRDNARTPMQWKSTIHGGFTSPSAQPWMRAHPNFSRINADAQIHDPASTFSYWKSMLAVRKKYKDVLIYGNFELIDRENQKVFAYKRRYETGDTMLVLCNFSHDKVEWDSEEVEAMEVAMSNYGRDLTDFDSGRILLEPYEAIALMIV